MGWQDVAALTIVGLCAIYVARVVRRALAGRAGACCEKPCGSQSQDVVSIEAPGPPAAKNDHESEPAERSHG